MLDVETRGGIVGMGYLFLFRPGMRTIAACLNECVIPRVLGKDASAVVRRRSTKLTYRNSPKT